jgi:hypothetical protein
LRISFAFNSNIDGLIESILFLIFYVFSVKAGLVSALRDGQYLKCVRIFLAAKEEWSTDSAFNRPIPMDTEGENDENDEKDEKEKKSEDIIKCIRNIFFGLFGLLEDLLWTYRCVVSDDVMGSNAFRKAMQPPEPSQDPSLVDELTKQQVLVQYLKVIYFVKIEFF